MPVTKDDLYILVKDVMRREVYEEKIGQLIEEHGGLINEDCAAFIVVDMAGCNSVPYFDLADVADGIDATVFLKVDGIVSVRTIKTKSSYVRIAELRASDKTGKCSLVLLGKHAESVDDGAIAKGANIKVVNAHVKVGDKEPELSVGWWGAVELEPAIRAHSKPPAKLRESFGIKVEKKFYNIDALSSLPEKTVVCVKATATDKREKRMFARKDKGGEGKVANLTLDDGTGYIGLVLWGSAADLADDIEVGDVVEVTKVRVKKGAKGNELHSISGTAVRKV